MRYVGDGSGGDGRSAWSLWSQDSFLSIASRGSVLSIGSVGSALSIGSVGSFASAFSIGSFASIGSGMSSLSRASLMSHRSVGATMGGDPGPVPPGVVLAAVGALAAVAGLVSRRRSGRLA